MDMEFAKPYLAMLARGGLTTVGGAMGLTGDGLHQWVGAGMVMAGFAWGWWNHEGQKKVLAIIAKMKPVAAPSATTAEAVKAANQAAADPTAAHLIVPLLMIAFLPLGLLALAPGVAQAQSPVKVAAKSRPIICDPANLIPGCRAAATASSASADPLQKLMDDIAKIDSQIVAGVISALNEADADASTLTNPSDPTSFRDTISHACYPAQIKFLQSLPQVVAIQSPSPYNLIVLFQRKRDLVAQIKAGLPGYLKVGCAALLQDEAQILAQTLGLIGVTAGVGVLAGIFPPAAPISLALPLLLPK